jgi:hypothetical protein
MYHDTARPKDVPPSQTFGAGCSFLEDEGYSIPDLGAKEKAILTGWPEERPWRVSPLYSAETGWITVK